MTLKVKIRRLEVEGFRGFRDKNVFEFPDGLTVIAGPVGSGKSSILSAIQFALYGLDFNTAVNIYQRENLVNIECDKTVVNLELEVSGEGVYRIERRLERSNGRLHENVTLQTPHGDVFDEPLKVEGIVEELLGLDFQEFIRSVSLGYVLIHMLTYGRSVSRSRAIDILLGISSIKAFHDSITPRKVKNMIDSLQVSLDSLKRDQEEVLASYSKVENRKRELEDNIREIQKKLEAITSRLKELEEVVKEYEEIKRRVEYDNNYVSRLKEKIKHAPSELDIYRIAEELEETKQGLKTIFERLVAPQEVLEKLESVKISVESITDAVKTLESLVDEAWSRYDSVWEDFQASQNELEQKKAELNALEKILVELESSVSEYENAEEEVQKIEDRYGSSDEIEKELKYAEQELRELSRKLQVYKSIQQLRQSLAESAAKSDRVECPVCGSQLDLSVIARLREDLGRVTKTILEQERKIQELEKKVKELRKVQDDLRNLKVILVDHEVDYEKYKEYMERKESLTEEIREDEVLLKEKERELRELSGNLTRLDEKLGEIKRKLIEQEASLEIAKIETELKKLEEARKKLEPHYNEYQRLKDEEKRLTETLANSESELRALEHSYLKQRLDELTTEIEELEARISKLEKLHSKLEKIRYALSGILTRQRREKIEALNRRTNEILKNVYPSEAITSVQLEIIEKRARKGAPPISYYEIYVETKSGRYRFNELLSDGQKTIVILALLLAIYSHIRHKAGFIMLDEPLPNVDDKVKIAFLNTLSKSENIPQVIVTTQAEELTQKVTGINIVRMQ